MQTIALALKANEPVIARLAALRDAARGSFAALTEELIARHTASIELTAGIEQEIALARRAIDDAHLSAHRRLDQVFGGRALTPAPSPMDGDEA